MDILYTYFQFKRVCILNSEGGEEVVYFYKYLYSMDFTGKLAYYKVVSQSYFLDGENDDPFPKAPPTNNKSHPRIVARVLSAAGHIALMHLYHLDVSILAELKRRHNIQEEEKEKKGKKSTSKTPGGSRRKSARDSTASNMNKV